MLPLIELIRAVPEELSYATDAALLPIASIASDSRQVEPGSLFIALTGLQHDGTKFIAHAKQAGAVAVLCDKTAQVTEPGIAVIRSENPRKALAHMAARFYPRQPEHMVAVTGTDGKTSTAEFTRQLWALMGKKSASIGTLGTIGEVGQPLYPGSYTTPDPVSLHKMLQELADAGYNHVAMEASSQGLDQYRMDGVRLEAAAFTNLTRDHLDYHKTEKAYFAAKERLFSQLLPEGKTALLSADDARYTTLRDICAERGERIIGFGKQDVDFQLKQCTPTPEGQQVEAILFGNPYTLNIPLVGAFQAKNILAALGLVIGTGGDMDRALAVIPHVKGVPGRLERVAQLRNGATVFIDYAHTPTALANILNTLRPHARGSLHVVFGCGGDRDAGKRPEMGRIASTLADEVIVTDDNPRSEVPALIRKAILAASPVAKEVADRREAIYVALTNLKPNDILVIAGKGHEKTQIIGNSTTPFDDAQVAREGVKELKLA